MGTGAQPYRLRHVVIGGRYRKCNITGDVHQFPLRQKCESRQRIGVLATRQRTKRPDIRLMYQKPRTVAIGNGAAPKQVEQVEASAK